MKKIEEKHELGKGLERYTFYLICQRSNLFGDMKISARGSLHEKYRN